MSAPLPMKATAGPLPTGDDWVYEVKWDGMRLVVVIELGVVTLWSANGRDVTRSYPELAGLGADLGVQSAVLDGEVVAFDDAGRPDFGRLQTRIHRTDPRQVAIVAAEVPVVLCLFDLLALDGTDTTALPWSQRRRLLETLVDAGPHWQVPAVHTDGAALLVAAEATDLEGVVAKRTTSTYTPGGRTRQWVKVKIRRRQEFVVGGWGAGDGGRAGRIGGLLVGFHDPSVTPAPLRFAGRVGSGITDAENDVLRALLDPIEVAEPPFDPAPELAAADVITWVAPTVVVEVAFAEWSAQGRLRHPVYAGRRIDVEPGSVTASP